MFRLNDCLYGDWEGYNPIIFQHEFKTSQRHLENEVLRMSAERKIDVYAYSGGWKKLREFADPRDVFKANFGYLRVLSPEKPRSPDLQ
jgi:hypothetical protein